jgi:hypothetical protein
VAEQSLFTLFDGDDMIARFGPTLLFNKGIFWRYRGKPLRNGKRLKTLIEMSKEDFYKEFNYSFNITIPKITTVESFIECYFDNKVSEDDLMTFENVVKVFKELNHDNKQRIDTVNKIFLNSINSQRLVVPEGLYNELRTITGIN